jgi:hypothetical protein
MNTKRIVPAIIDLIAGMVILLSPLPEFVRFFGVVSITKSFVLFYKAFTEKEIQRKYYGWGSYLR